MCNRLICLFIFISLFILFVDAKVRIGENQAPFTDQAMERQPRNLKVMTLNTWNLAKYINGGLSKIAKYIELIDPDIIGIQEVTSVVKFYVLMFKLGCKWSAAYEIGSSTAIITKHKILKNETHTVMSGTGATILINGTTPVHVYSMHLDSQSYGPYVVNNKLVKEQRIIDAGEHMPEGRVSGVDDLISAKTFKKWLNLATSTIPLIVLGDFNSPSHLDYIEANKDQHGGWVYNWPATYLLQSKTKLIDSYREVYPDPVADPGITWSTIQKFSGSDWNWTVPEPQDRIDFIYYRSSNLKTVASEVYAGKFQPYPHSIKDNDWPSDHYAVISAFEWVNDSTFSSGNTVNL